MIRHMNRLDRFTFMPGELKKVTDPAEVAAAQKSWFHTSN